jgi:Zn-dependent peptidase ImmA (M78 family)
MARALRRAVRAQCEQIALDARSRLSLAAGDRLEPHTLAEHLGIGTLSLETFREAHPEAVEQLVKVNPGAFSGALVPFEERQTIVFNPVHPPTRHRHTICHELAHLLLEHKPEPPFDRDLKRRFNPIDESEADYLAEALLVPLIAARPAVERFGNDIDRAAEHFGVSSRLMRARLSEGSRLGESTRLLQPDRPIPDGTDTALGPDQFPNKTD